jgi:hypothetical protein
MVALESERAPISAEPAVEAAAPQTEAPVAQELSSEGAVPEVGPGTEPPVGATASEQAFGHKPTAPSGEMDAGMFEPEQYQAACQAAGTPDKWDPRYAHGHTEASGWSQPYEGRYDNAFHLKAGHSASQAVLDFVSGPTIADYRVIGVAMEMNELRDQIGEQRFDEMFGSKDSLKDAKISSAQRLKITSGMYTIPFADQMLALAAENEALDKAKTAEAEEPQVAAGQEQLETQGGATSTPAPEMIADELGIQPQQELA